MDQTEVLKRVIGILTQAGAWIHEPEEPTDPELEGGPGVVTQLLNDVMPTITIPAEATADEIGPLLSEALGGRILQLSSAFAMAFWELAEVHDSGRTDISSQDVLRELALRAETDLD
ncbi:hypothetical protein AB0D08_25130 [Kitasatospora sp. NPDC048540]|uniref:hypothetical protein n=1 Tax=unclassified Kitasatospora TaxID=2633591 RepID=UPI00053A394A|nr:hypothetical protein [Kitasatospora sp. MBT63]